VKIKHYLYNTFIIEKCRIKIAIDPGQNLNLFKREVEKMGIECYIMNYGDGIEV
jgi:hypothetical protein